MRRTAASCLILVLAAACGGSGHDRLARGSSTPAGDSSASATGPGATSNTTSAASGPSGPADSSGPIPPAIARRDVAPARTALDAYLDALVARDASKLLANSSKAAAAIGAIRLTVAQFNALGQGTTSVNLTRASFTPSQADDSAVTFAGSAQLDTTVSGPKGTRSSNDTISGPVRVEQAQGVWRVANFGYDSASMVHEPENATQAASGLHVTVAFVLSYATSTGAFLQLGAERGHEDVHLESATLVTTTGTEQQEQSFFTGSAEPVGLVTFARTDATPIRLDLTFRRGDGSALSYSLALSGRPS